jgi:mannosyltransferase
MLVQDRTGVAAVAQNESTPWMPRLSADAVALGVILVAGAAVRFVTISSQSYWYDEAATVHLMRLPFGSMLSGIGSQESTPPLYYVLAWLWSKLFGTGEAGLRSLSALAGTAVIVIAYLCGRELVSRRAGLIAAALAAVNPFLIWYSQEARAYMLLVALSGASLLFFARAWRAPSARNLGWWAVLSALALLTHFFAGFLVAPEAVMLLYRGRNRATVAAVAAVAAVQVALLPLAVSDASHPLQGWITSFPLAIRIQQVPVAFGLGTLYESTIVSYGLLAAAALAGCVIVLLVIGADGDQLRGAGRAAAVAGFVVLVPLLLALAGRDYYIARNLLPAWIPIAVVIGAACAAPRTRTAGAVLAIALLAGSIWALVRIDSSPQYQRPDWRGVAAALGAPSGPRAIVAYDGPAATVPLSIYLPGARTPAAQAPVTVRELDVVGNAYDRVSPSLPAGSRLIASRDLDGYLVERFSFDPGLDMTPDAFADRATTMVVGGAASPAVLTQP